MGYVLTDIRSYFFTHRHSVLLIAIVATVASRPLIGNVGAGPIIFSLLMATLMLVSLYTISVDEMTGERETLLAQRRRRNIIGWSLAIPAIIDRVVVIVAPNHTLYVMGATVWFLMFAFITVNELRGVLRQKEITAETISWSVSIYLLIGFTFGLLYIVIYQFQPGAFSLAGLTGPNGGPPAEQQVFPVLLYFSLTTLSTIGFGDVLPLSLQTRYLAVAEGITGQFYLAILVARLVGIYMSRTTAVDSQKTGAQA